MTRPDKGTRTANGESSVFFSESDGYWHGFVTMGIKDDGSLDRRHCKSKSEQKLRKKVKEFEADREAGRLAQTSRVPTLAEWMAFYLDTICTRLVASGKMAPRTLDDYRSKTRVWIIPLLGQHRLNRLLPEHLDKAYSQMHLKGRSPSTVLKVHRILSRALSVAVRREKLNRNVATLIDAPAAADTEIEAFTREEARRILKAAEGRRNAARWSVALALGIRQGEALGLRWSYIDLESGVIRAWFQVQQANFQHGCEDPHACGAKWHRPPCKTPCRIHVHTPDCSANCKNRKHACPKRPCGKNCGEHARFCPRRTGGGIVFRPRKGRRKLTLQCPPELLPVLRAHRETQDLERLMVGDAWQDHDLLFPRPNGTPESRTEDWKEWKRLLKIAGVRDGRLHDARHTAGTLLIEQGVHIRVVQEILGHTRVTTTEKYTHVAAPQVRDATARMGAALWGE
ncbi:tyrosine-type recombinase/integrase [Streptosporangium sp. NBC_01495]|uniref:tyrosine-type recombinase/integrase n=1 Tax=Streptosporangium sp. NBC_01495 TaxID=2903899 RepID=UPI002E32B3C4|nr:tyrosine-type recombinase/integrase [Streptosporangium sp. NBC_01495]